MKRATSRWADTVFSRTWQLKDDLSGATPEQFRTAQAELKHLLDQVKVVEETARPSHFLGYAYPLVCWIDEQMVGDPQLGSTWSKALLEDQLFGTADRNWRFWEQAEIAETQAHKDALTLFFLCVAHGFTGALQSDPQALEEWVQRAKNQIARPEELSLPFPTALAPPPAVPPLHGRRMMRSMVQAACVASLLLLPTLSYLGLRACMR